MADEYEDEERTGPHRPPRLRNLARRIFREVDAEGGREAYDDHSAADSDGPEGAEVPPGRGAGRGDKDRTRADPWALLGALLETGDKAKTEMVKMLAREVRSYLEALELHKDLHHLFTNYSLEVKTSINLKPLADAVSPSTPDVAEPVAEATPEESTGDVEPSRS